MLAKVDCEEDLLLRVLCNGLTLITLLYADEQFSKLAMETLDELDWCLDQLETIQTHRSVSDMATSKVMFLHYVLFCFPLFFL